MQRSKTASSLHVAYSKEALGAQNVVSVFPVSSSRKDAGLRAPKRIVHLLKHCGYGNGNVHVAVDLACVQARAGYDVIVASGGGTFEPLLAEHGVRHMTLEQDQKRPWSLVTAAYQLTKLAWKWKPDVFHAHMMGSAIVGYAAALISRVPLVTTVHNSFDRHSVLMRLGRRVVAVSEAEKRHLVSQGYADNSVDVVMNAPVKSPREAFMKNERDPILKSPSILAVCGLHRRKGVFDLIAACASLFSAFADWVLYVAGEGPDLEELRELTRSLGIEDRVIFLGFIPAPRTLLEQADIFVLASYADPCSLVIGEARGAGCAIVATSVGGTPEMLEFGRAGRLVSPGKPAELAAALESLMADGAARAALKQAALHGSEVFDVHRLIGDYEVVYRRAMNRQHLKYEPAK